LLHQLEQYAALFLARPVIARGKLKCSVQRSVLEYINILEYINTNSQPSTAALTAGTPG